MSISVDGDYVATLGDTNGDGVLSPSEIAAGTRTLPRVPR